jgi:hypothetical protein
MDNRFILTILELVIGILFNIFIGRLGMIVFRKDDKMTRIILRFIGVFCIIDALMRIYQEYLNW